MFSSNHRIVFDIVRLIHQLHRSSLKQVISILDAHNDQWYSPSVSAFVFDHAPQAILPL
jgi:hypothetical protein